MAIRRMRLREALAPLGAVYPCVAPIMAPRGATKGRVAPASRSKGAGKAPKRRSKSSSAAASSAPVPQNSEGVHSHDDDEQPEAAPAPTRSEDHVARVMKDKLAGYDPLEVCSVVGKTTGKSPKEFIVDHIRQNKRPTKANLASSFWVSFFQEFDLTSSRFAKLDSMNDQAGEPIGDELSTLR